MDIGESVNTPIPNMRRKSKVSCTPDPWRYTSPSFPKESEEEHGRSRDVCLLCGLFFYKIMVLIQSILVDAEKVAGVIPQDKKGIFY